MEHSKIQPVHDKGEPIFYPCENCVIFTWQTIVDIAPIMCTHDERVGFDYNLRCDTCGRANVMHKPIIVCEEA